MRALNSNPNVDNSDLVNYPDGRIKDNTGTGNGTGVNERVKGDMHQAIAKLMRLYGIIPNGLPDNETNGFQIIEALKSLASKNDYILPITNNSGVLNVPIKLGMMIENEQVVCQAQIDLGTQTQIKGLDATTFTFSSNGSFKTNEYVRLIKTSAGIELSILCDYVPNLATRLSNIETSFATIQSKLSIFTVGGTIFPWGKLIIPTGFQEVIDFRGKTVFGMDTAQTEFAVLNSFSGTKNHTIIEDNIPLHSFTYQGSVLEGNHDDTPGGGTPHWKAQQLQTSSFGKLNPDKINHLNPYGVKIWIEWATV